MTFESGAGEPQDLESQRAVIAACPLKLARGVTVRWA